MTEESIPEQELEYSIKDEEEESGSMTPTSPLRVPSIEEEKKDNYAIEKRSTIVLDSEISMSR